MYNSSATHDFNYDLNDEGDEEEGDYGTPLTGSSEYVKKKKKYEPYERPKTRTVAEILAASRGGVTSSVRQSVATTDQSPEDDLGASEFARGASVFALDSLSSVGDLMESRESFSQSFNSAAKKKPATLSSDQQSASYVGNSDEESEKSVKSDGSSDFDPEKDLTTWAERKKTQAPEPAVKKQATPAAAAIQRQQTRTQEEEEPQRHQEEDDDYEEEEAFEELVETLKIEEPRTSTTSDKPRSSMSSGDYDDDFFDPEEKITAGAELRAARAGILALGDGFVPQSAFAKLMQGYPVASKFPVAAKSLSSPPNATLSTDWLKGDFASSLERCAVANDAFDALSKDDEAAHINAAMLSSEDLWRALDLGGARALNLDARRRDGGPPSEATPSRASCVDLWTSLKRHDNDGRVSRDEFVRASTTWWEQTKERENQFEAEEGAPSMTYSPSRKSSSNHSEEAVHKNREEEEEEAAFRDRMEDAAQRDREEAAHNHREEEEEEEEAARRDPREEASHNREEAALRDREEEEAAQRDRGEAAHNREEEEEEAQRDREEEAAHRRRERERSPNFDGEDVGLLLADEPSMLVLEPPRREEQRPPAAASSSRPAPSSAHEGKLGDARAASSALQAPFGGDVTSIVELAAMAMARANELIAEAGARETRLGMVETEALLAELAQQLALQCVEGVYPRCHRVELAPAPVPLPPPPPDKEPPSEEEPMRRQEAPIRRQQETEAPIRRQQETEDYFAAQRYRYEPTSEEQAEPIKKKKKKKKKPVPAPAPPPPTGRTMSWWESAALQAAGLRGVQPPKPAAPDALGRRKKLPPSLPLKGGTTKRRTAAKEEEQITRRPLRTKATSSPTTNDDHYFATEPIIEEQTRRYGERSFGSYPDVTYPDVTYPDAVLPDQQDNLDMRAVIAQTLRERETERNKDRRQQPMAADY